MAEIIVWPKGVTFNTKGVSPLGVYVDGDDFLRWKLYTTGTSGRFYIRGRLINSEGKLRIINEILDIPSGSNYVTRDVLLEEGFLQQLSVRPSSSLNVDLGDVFTIVSLVRGKATEEEPYESMFLIQNYVSSGFTPSYPTSDLIDPIRSEGHKKIWIAQNIPSQATTNFVVPPYAYYKLLAIKFFAVTSSTTGNRNYMWVIYDDNMRWVYSSQIDASQIASKSIMYTWGIGENFRTDVQGWKYYPLPDNIFLRPNYTLQFQQSGNQTGDAIQVFTVWVEKRMTLV